MAHRVFISLTKSDTAIAEAIRDGIDTLFGDLIQVHFSTSKEIGGGIGGGEDWLRWIDDQVTKCDFALVLITPTSAQTPWILWESGAVYGATVAGESIGVDKIRPLIYQISPDQVPSPILESKIQLKRGDERNDFQELMFEIYNLYKDELSASHLQKFTLNLPDAISQYLQTVEELLLTAPVQPTSNVIEEWRLRLDELMKDRRMSEVEQLHDWMNIAFGGAVAESRPLDLRIHTRLGGIYMSAKQYDKAAEQLELARRLVPRDIYNLVNLGRAYLECGKRDETREILDRIETLDETAVQRSAECAGLQGRWHYEGEDWESARKTYHRALRHNPDSYYLANVAAEAYLKAGRHEDAADSFKKALEIIERIEEDNVWTAATAANAAFYLRDDEKAQLYLRKIREHRPTPSQFATIKAGLNRIASSVDPDKKRAKVVLKALL